MPSIPPFCERCDVRPPTETRRDEVLERNICVCGRCARWYDEHETWKRTQSGELPRPAA